MEGLNHFNMLPEDCVSTILSLTSPLDACRSSLVSSTFRSAMESDIVWDKFLPSGDYLDNIISRSVNPLKHFSSTKELFLSLCDPVLIDSGKMSFRLQKSSGRKSYILSARALSITCSNNPMYWLWVSTPESRFSEAAVLRTTHWLEIEGKIKVEMLSPNTMYGAYLIMKISDRAYGFDSVAAEVSVEVGDQVSSSGRAFLVHDQDRKKLPRMIIENDDHDHDERVSVPCEKENGWMEIELGEFFINGDECDHGQEVKMSLKEVKGYQLKGGLAVEGIEVRPKQ